MPDRPLLPGQQSEEDMIREVEQNALKRIRALESEGLAPPRPKELWAPSELWPGEDYLHINNMFTDYRLV